jgi:5-methyltetrahydrofolate--homocysteine methyltransferase
VGDEDIEVIDEDGSIYLIHQLRQQQEKGQNQPNYSLADFIAPKASGKTDALGAFAVTTGIGIDERVKKFEAAHDDYSAIMLKALADRLAEAFAELMHEKLRRDHWGYAPDEDLQNTDLVKEKYRGIRPAPGYPSCPDHNQKAALWKLLDVERNTGIKLTESFAMLPAASVSGFYYAHPLSRYFSVGKIYHDQVEDYSSRTGMDVKSVERWLAANLGYR